MPYLLYIDTAAATATAALSLEGAAIAVRTHSNANEQAAVLNAMIGSVCEEAGISLRDMSGICICAGPGSYTGLRVGLSTAKGLAYGLDKPLMLFNRLDLLAAAYHPGKPFAIAIKARNGEYFFAQYDASGACISAPQHVFQAELEAMAATGILFITDDEAFPETGSRQLFDNNAALPLLPWIKQAEKRFAAGQFDDLAYSEPFYLKAAYTTQSKK